MRWVERIRRSVCWCAALILLLPGCNFFADVNIDDAGRSIPTKDMTLLDMAPPDMEAPDMTPADMRRDMQMSDGGQDMMTSCVSSCEEANMACGVVANPCEGVGPLNCGTCVLPELCLEGACLCFGETDSMLCEAQGTTCGNITVVDRCNKEVSAYCGKCRGNESCVDGGCVRR